MLTVKEAAAELAVSTRFVYRLCATGEIDSYRLGSTIRIRKEAIERYLEAQKKGASQRSVVTPQGRKSSLSVLRLRG